MPENVLILYFSLYFICTLVCMKHLFILEFFCIFYSIKMFRVVRKKKLLKLLNVKFCNIIL